MSQPYIQPAQFDNWGTPKAFFDVLDREFHFDLDPAAQKWSAKCSMWCGPDHPEPNWRDGLLFCWRGCRPFVNPPYGAVSISQWILKARQESESNLTTTVMLLPNTTDTAWFHEHVYSSDARQFYPWAECRFIRGRIKFDPPPGYVGKAPGPGKGNIIVIIRPL